MLTLDEINVKHSAGKRWQAVKWLALLPQQFKYPGTYRTVERAVTFVSPLLDMALQCTGVQWLEKLEAAKKLT